MKADDARRVEPPKAACSDTGSGAAASITIRYKLTGVERPGLFMPGDGGPLPRVQNIAGRVEMTLLNNSDTDICIAHLGSLSLWLRHRTSPSVRSFRDHRSCLAGKGNVAVHTLSLAPHGTRTLTAAVDLLTEQDHPAPALAEYDVVFRAIRTAGNPALSRDAAGRLVYKTCIEAMESPGSEDPPELWTGAVDLGRSPLVLHPPDDTETTQADWE